MVCVGVVGKRIDADTATRHEISRYLQVFGIHQFYQILHDDVHAVLMEIAVIAKREEIEFETLALHHPLGGI